MMGRIAEAQRKYPELSLSDAVDRDRIECDGEWAGRTGRPRYGGDVFVEPWRGWWRAAYDKAIGQKGAV